MRLRFALRALGDLNSIHNYLSERSISGPAKVGSAIQRATENIRSFPKGGKLAGLNHVRVLPVGGYPYLIYWEVSADEVRILHIRHAARMPWLGETK